MSGGNLNYQLRPNKYVERALFVELLSKICGAKTHTYAYVSMGGPQLEDHRLIHKTLGIKKLYSFEIDKNVLLRQQFNKSPSVLTCLSGSISHFIDDFEGFTEREKLKKYKLIIWLDYASGEWLSQLTEFQKLISKLTLGDTLKITMSANISSLGSKDPNNKENTETIESIRYKCMGNKIGDYMPNDIPKVINDENDLVKILARSIQFASERGAESLLGLEPALLSLFTYKDGVRMITATVRIMNKVDLSLLKVIDWEFTPDSWQNITKIEIPELSVKERLHLDSLLPSENVEDIHTQLSFKLHTKHEDSLNMLKSYAAHYRRYPGYQIVA